MEVRKSNGKTESYSTKKLSSIIKKVYKSANIELGENTTDEIINSLNVFDGIPCSIIRKQLEDQFLQRDEKLYYAYKRVKDRKDAVKDFVATKTEFINNYKRSSNTANATIDDNSNVANKNIGILNAEIHKPDNIQISRGMMQHKLKELFPEFDEKQYVKDLESHIIYKHDESSFAGAIAPYTYSAKEVVEVLYNSKSLLLPLDLLYEIVDEPEILVDPENEVYQKLPWHLYIKDLNNEYTEVTHLTRKKRHRDLVRVKTAFGEDLVVTDNHPLITDIENIENTVDAINGLGEKQYRVDTKLKFKGKETIDLVSILPTWVQYGKTFLKYQQVTIKRYIPVNKELGYVVGFFIGDGGYDNTSKSIEISQKEREVLDTINNILYETIGIVGNISKGSGNSSEKYVLHISNQYFYELLRGYFKIQDKAQNKTLPYNILEFNEEFAKGILCGLIDSDGTIRKEDCGICLRLSSRAGILQATALFRHFGYSIGNGMQSLPFSNNTSYHTNYTIWGVNATKREDSADLSLSFKVKNNLVNSKSSSLKYKTAGYCNITNVDVIEQESAFLLQNEYIYDITTKTHTFCSNNLLVHNCCSISMYPFLNTGLKNIGGLSAAPKNIDSFCGMYVNLIFATSAMFAGAVATPEFLLYFTYFAKKEWGDDFWKRPNEVVTRSSNRERTIIQQIHQYWQQVVYSINQPAAARGLQSAFVNWAYFDKPFFEGMFGNFYFPDGTQPDWESLQFIQREALLFINETRLRNIVAFPVESFALIYKDGHFLDEESAKFVAEEYARGHSFFTYISDTVDSLSSCCFDGNTRIMYALEDENCFEKCVPIKEAYEKNYDKTIEVLGYNPYTKVREWVKGKFIKATSNQLYKITFNDRADWTELIVTHDHIFPIIRDGKCIDINAKNIKEGDKLLADKAQWTLSFEDEKEIIEVEIKSIEKIEEEKDVYCIELNDQDSPYFVLANGIITHNCRLKNKVQTKEFNFTNGNMGIETGSKSVITLNLSRIVQNWARTGADTEDYDSLKEYLYSILERVYLYQVAYNELLWDMYDADLLPVYKAGFIDLNKQYLTIGINGLNQSAEFLGIKCNDNPRYEKHCQKIFGAIKEFNEMHKCKFNGHQVTFNTECVPAESLAIKNYNWDKADGYWVPEDTNLYASYIYKPNDKNISVLEKIRLHGSRYIGDFLDGGSSAHINLSEHLTADQYERLLKYAAEEGCQFLGWNIPNCSCDDCGYIAKQPFKKCPNCGSTHVSLWDRVIG